MQPTKAESELQPTVDKSNTLFVNWLFDLYLASTLNPDLDNYVAAEAMAFRRKYATRLKAKELRVLSRLEQSPQAAKLLTSCLTDLDFRL